MMNGSDGWQMGGFGGISVVLLVCLIVVGVAGRRRHAESSRDVPLQLRTGDDVIQQSSGCLPCLFMSA